jgi:hypothetical protein
MIASYYGYFEILKFLIENNADVNIQDNVLFLFFFNLFLICLYNNNKFCYL